MFLRRLDAADAIVICPSNPWVSVDPILSIPGIREVCERKQVLAVSPIIAGQALKGPAAKMYAELGIPPSAEAVAAHYGDLLAGFILDNQDREQGDRLHGVGLPCLVTDTIMRDAPGRSRLAREVLAFLKTLPLAV